MKRLLSIFLCAALLTGGFSRGLSASAANPIETQNMEETLEEEIPSPDKVSPEGQAALDAFYSNQSYPKVNFLAWNDWIPTGDEIDSIRIYRSENLSLGSYNEPEECYLITDTNTIKKICQALRNTNGSHTTNLIEVTGYDTAEYARKYSMELSYGTSYMRWDFPEDFENYMILVSNNDLAYSDVPYLVENRKELTQLLDQLTRGKNSNLFVFVGKRPNIKRIDKQAHTYTSITDASKTDIDRIYAVWNALQPIQNFSNLSTPINQNLYYSLSDGNYQMKFIPTELGGNCTVESWDGFSADNRVYEFLNDDFFVQVEYAMKNLPEHPSWFCGILDKPNIAVAYAPKRSNAFQSMYSSGEADIQKLLGKITVKKDSFQKVDKKYKLKNAFTLKVRDLAKDREHINSTYLISMNDTQLLIQNDSVSYGALYTLDDLNGNEIWQQIEQIELNHQPMPE